MSACGLGGAIPTAADPADLYEPQYFKLPILTSIELVNEASSNSVNAMGDGDGACVKENVLFKDYVLIPSLTKYKHLIHTVYDEVQLEDKFNFNIVEGNCLGLFF